METLSLRELAIPMIKAIDSFNYLLKSHHRRTAVISYAIGKEMGLSEKELFELIVAAALHDIGALSVQERDSLLIADVENPIPHCIMGHRMLASFDAFATIAQTIKHHHIVYEDCVKMPPGEVLLNSHIIHLADRVDIMISPNEFILNQKTKVAEAIRERVGKIFHPDVFEAFLRASKPDVFWIEINNLELEKLFNKINVKIDFDLTIDNIVEFALTLSRIVDFRSKFTASHSYTVAQLAYMFGGFLGFDDDRRKKLLIAGYFHDIGKIGIDPSIIEKEGPLSDEEFNMIKLHSYYTGQILQELSNSNWFSEIVVWAERHHEKNNGTGYPYSLSEQDMDDGVKLLALADVITALMEDRPYRKSLSVDEAFKIVKEKLGPLISNELFAIVDQHRNEVNEEVQKCRMRALNVYYEGLGEKERQLSA